MRAIALPLPRTIHRPPARLVLIAVYVLANLGAAFFFMIEIVLGIHGRVMGLPVPIKALLLSLALLLAALRWREFRAAVRLWLDGHTIAAVRPSEWVWPVTYLALEVAMVLSALAERR